jgi:hypothetical protein
MSEKVREWFYLDANKAQKGPIPTTVLARLIEKGIGVSPTTLVWKNGMDAWKQVIEVCFVVLPFFFIEFKNAKCYVKFNLNQLCRLSHLKASWIFKINNGFI